MLTPSAQPPVPKLNLSAGVIRPTTVKGPSNHPPVPPPGGKLVVIFFFDDGPVVETVFGS